MRKIIFIVVCVLSYMAPVGRGQAAWAGGVAFIGDSQSATAGAFFDRLRRELGSSVEFKSGTAVCGASIENYYSRVKTGTCRGTGHMTVENGAPVYHRSGGKTQFVSNFLTSDVDTIIVQLGDNNWAENGADPAIARKARALAQEIAAKGKRCIWITPASISSSAQKNCSKWDFRKHEISKALTDALEGTACKVVDSHAATSEGRMEPGSGCVHYTPSSYGKWAAMVAPEVRELLGSTQKQQPATQAPRTRGKKKTAVGNQ